MILLCIGLILFIGIHSVRIISDDFRSRFIMQRGEGAWKGVYAAISLVGFVLLIYGYGLTRLDPTYIWNPPVVTKHIASFLMLFSFVLLTAAYIPNNVIKAKLRHPMTMAVKVWAFSHLIANGRLGDILLFGTFLIWAVLTIISCKKRDRSAVITSDGALNNSILATVSTIAIGLVAYCVFAAWLHIRLMGVSPF
ncbi:MAG: NnrU family protein [Granulosicoccus sp.]